MINTIEELIAQCKNKIEIVGSLYELALFFNKRNDSVVLEYKGVVRVDNAFIHIIGQIYENDRAFYNFLDEFGISYKLTKDILHKEYSTTHELIKPHILTVHVNDQRVYTKSNSSPFAPVYVSGKTISYGRVKSQYIRIARPTEEHNIKYELVGIPYCKDDKGDMEILIADDYHHQSLILPLNTPINVGYLYSFILDWYRVDTQDVVIVAVHNTSISGANLIDNIKDELIQQPKTEYDIFIEAMKGR